VIFTANVIRDRRSIGWMYYEDGVVILQGNCGEMVPDPRGFEEITRDFEQKGCTVEIITQGRRAA